MLYRLLYIPLAVLPQRQPRTASRAVYLRKRKSG